MSSWPSPTRRLTRRRLLYSAAAGTIAGTAGTSIARAGSAKGYQSTDATAARQSGQLPAPVSGGVREYWIQAESFPHNLVPSGRDEMMGMTFTAAQTSYQAIGYRAYTPGWGRPLPASTQIGPNTGIPGPVIRGQVGDTIKVHFSNNDTHYRFPHSIHPHGVRYDRLSDAAYLAAGPEKPGAAVPPGETYTYTWQCVPGSAGTWPYHDHSQAQQLTTTGQPVMELNAELGMLGFVVVTDVETSPVDREFFLFFHDIYQEHVPSVAQDFDCFNGYAYLGNTPTFTARAGERVRWRIAALGKEFHVFHLHGHRWQDEAGRNTDSQLIGPSTTLTVEFTEDNPGDWLYHCHVTEHMEGGMIGWYRVLP